MRVSLYCMQCRLRGHPTSEWYSLEVRSNGLYHFTCDRGHANKTVVLNERFEILFDLALHAMIDGYCREAVSSAAASLERFYQLSEHVLIRAKFLADSGNNFSLANALDEEFQLTSICPSGS